MRFLFKLLCVVGLALTVAGSASAVIYKNPAHSFGQGDFTAGIIFDNGDRDVESDAVDEEVGTDIDSFMGAFGFGIGTGGMLELRAGTLEGKFDEEGFEEADGSIFGAIYRHNLSGTGGDVAHGLLAGFHSGYTENEGWETDVTQIDFGYGVAFPLGPQGAIYAGGVFSQLDGEVFVPQSAGLFASGRTIEFEGADVIGGFAGVEFEAGEQLKIGAEMHAIHESSFGFYVDGVF